MTEMSYPWDGVDLGDAATYAPYFAEDWHQMYSDMLAMDGSYGVFMRAGNALEATLTVNDTPCIVDTGSALVAGQFYRNTAAVSLTILREVALTRYDRVVVRRTWATKLSRLTLVAGVPGAGVPVALETTLNVLYDIPIAIIQVPAAGNMIITDDRVYRGFPDVSDRQGGSATAWNTAGTTTRKTGAVRIQCGEITCAAGGSFGVTFPVPFAQIPLVFLTTDGNVWNTAWIGSCTVNGCTGGILEHTLAGFFHASANAKTVAWLAIGQE